MSKKIQYIDLLRIYATLCVIMLHCINPILTNAQILGLKSWWLCNAINSFARTGVPIFFMISGYLLLTNEKTLDFVNFYKCRLSRIILPFLVWDLIYYIVNKITAGESVLSTDFLAELINDGSKYHLWFVYMLLGIYLFLPFIKRILDSCNLKQCLWLLILIMFPTTIRPFINTFTPLYIKLFDPVMEGYLSFFILGYILGKYEIKKNFRILIYIGGAIGFFMGIFGIFLMSARESMNFFFNGGYQINHFLLASAVFVLFRHLKEIKNAAISKAITAYSGLTYGIYLIHVLIIGILYKYIQNLSPAAEAAVFFVITAIISSLVIFIISKIKYVNRFFM